MYNKICLKQPHRRGSMSQREPRAKHPAVNTSMKHKTIAGCSNTYGSNNFCFYLAWGMQIPN